MTRPDERKEYERLARAHAALKATPEGERAAWLEQLAERDPGTAEDLAELVDASRSAAALFADAEIDGRSGLPPDALVPRDPREEPLPEAIGPYRILRHLGSGGMGVVYEADAPSPRRKVAVKLIRPEMAEGTRLRRFRQEAEAQGRLKHPGIAQVYATGSCDLGGGKQPYMVLELVRGDALLVHAQRERLDTRQRLILVAQLCAAIQHAHEHGVVHRDLKPDNILLDLDGQPKVLDFGIARVVADGKAPLTTIHTAHGDIVGTLTHMAPEQLSGDPEAVGPATDIYALGVIAFELLSGRLPHDVAGRRIADAIRQVTEREAPRLGSLEPSLRGDVEIMVGKALERDPERRYVSAAAFGEDLRRFNAHQTIAARRPSLFYRGARFARRNRGLTAGFVLSAVTLLAATVSVLRYAQGESRARKSADQLALQSLAASTAAVAVLLDGGERWSAYEQLARVPPALRGWEWRWLAAQTPLVVPGLDPQLVAWSGRYLAALSDVRPLQPPERDFARRIHVADLLEPGAPLRTVEGMSSARQFVPEQSSTPGGPCTTGRVAALGKIPVEGSLGSALFRDAVGILDVEKASYRGMVPIDIVDEGPGADREAVLLGYFDGQLLAGCYNLDSMMKGWTWDPVQLGALAVGREWRPERELPSFHVPSHCIVDPTAQYALVCPERAQIAPCILHRLDTWEEIGRMKQPPEGKRQNQGAFRPDGERVAFLNARARIDVHRLPDLAFERSISIPRAIELQWPSDDEILVGGRNYLRWIDAETGAILEEHHTDNLEGTADLHPTLPLFAYAGGRSQMLCVGLRGMPQPPPSLVIDAHTQWIYPCAVSPSGDLIASSAPTEPHILLLDGWSGEVLAHLPRALSNPEGYIYADRMAPLVFSEDGCSLVSTEPDDVGLHVVRYNLLDGSVKRGRSHGGETDWASCSPEQVHDLLAELGDIRGRSLGPRIAGHPDGKRLFAANYVINHDRSSISEQTAIVGTEERDRDQIPGTTLSVGVSPDLERLAVGELGKVRILSLPSGRLIATALDEGRGISDIYAVAWSPDGERLAVGDSTGRIRILQTGSYDTVAELPSHARYVFSLAWSPDGTRLISTSGDPELRIHDSVHPVHRLLQSEDRKERVTRQQARLDVLMETSENARAAARILLAEAGSDARELQAARRACLLRWVR